MQYKTKFYNWHQQATQKYMYMYMFLKTKLWQNTLLYMYIIRATRKGFMSVKGDKEQEQEQEV